MPALRPELMKPVFEPYYGLVRPKQPLFNIGGTDYRQLTPKRPMVIRKGRCVHKCFYFNGMKSCMGVQCYWPKVGTCYLYDRMFSRTKAGRIAAVKINRIKAIRANRARHANIRARALKAKPTFGRPKAGAKK